MDDNSGIFSGNERKEKEQQMLKAGRLPPGQSLTLKWPVLHYGSVPRFDPARWDFHIRGLVEQPVRLKWDEFNNLPKVKTHSDFHCVTRWSRFDNDWQGVAFQEVLKLVKLKPEVKYVLVHAEQGFTANVPLIDLDRDDVLFATHHDGQPLIGGPRLSSAADRAASLCLEISEVGARAGVYRPRCSGFLGTERLPHVWRSVSGAAV